MGSRSYLKSTHRKFSLPDLIFRPRHSGSVMFTVTRTRRKPPILNPLSSTSTFSTTPSVSPMHIPTSFVWLIVGSPWIWTQNDTLSKHAFWAESPACSLWRMRSYLSYDQGPSCNTLSRSSIVWNRNKALFSPKSLTSKFAFVFHAIFNTLATDSKLTHLLV